MRKTVLALLCAFLSSGQSNPKGWHFALQGLPDGQIVERNAWKVHSVDELGLKQLENRLRSGVKETTLDYTRDFAERRGIAKHLGMRSQIELRPEQERIDNHALSPVSPGE